MSTSPLLFSHTSLSRTWVLGFPRTVLGFSPHTPSPPPPYPTVAWESACGVSKSRGTQRREAPRARRKGVPYLPETAAGRRANSRGRLRGKLSPGGEARSQLARRSLSSWRWRRRRVRGPAGAGGGGARSRPGPGVRAASHGLAADRSALRPPRSL